MTTYAVRGLVFEDSDGNGVRDPWETAGVPGVTIRIWQGGSLVATVVTDGSGAYDVPGLLAGATIVEELQPPGYVSTTPDNVALDLTADVAVDFGEQPVVATPTPTATPIPVTMELRATYRYLLWYGPITQVLTGRYTGPTPLGGPHGADHLPRALGRLRRRQHDDGSRWAVQPAGAARLPGLRHDRDRHLARPGARRRPPACSRMKWFGM